jgi:hypothetical protein
LCDIATRVRRRRRATGNGRAEWRASGVAERAVGLVAVAGRRRGIARPSPNRAQRCRGGGAQIARAIASRARAAAHRRGVWRRAASRSVALTPIVDDVALRYRSFVVVAHRYGLVAAFVQHSDGEAVICSAAQSSLSKLFNNIYKYTHINIYT